MAIAAAHVAAPRGIVPRARCRRHSFVLCGGVSTAHVAAAGEGDFLAILFCTGLRRVHIVLLGSLANPESRVALVAEQELGLSNVAAENFIGDFFLLRRDSELG